MKLKIFIFSLFFCAVHTNVTAQDASKVHLNFLPKNSIVANAKINVLDPVSTSQYSEMKYEVLVNLKYGKENLSDVSSRIFTYRITYSLQYFDQNGVYSTSIVNGDPLVIEYDATQPANIVLESYQKNLLPAGMAGATLTILTVTDKNLATDVSTVPADVRLEMSLIATYKPVLPSILSFKGAINYDAQKLELSWPYQKEANAYQVEWCFIDFESDYYNQNITASDYFLVKEPVRLVTNQQYTSFDLKYPQGKVYVRVRAVWQYGGINKTQEHYSNWQYATNPIVFNTSFEQNKNWQRTTTFAEEGKMGTSVSYLDGVFMTRQTVGLKNTEQMQVVSETLYDYEGRPTVNIMPYPVAGTSLNYRFGENTFVGSTPQTEKKMYDNPYISTSTPTSSPTLSTASGASNYYSSLNNLSQSHKDYIANANGYAYSQVQFMSDGTGRALRQNLPGEAFKMQASGGNFVSYYYTNATSNELYRLFGSNVGDASHYEKSYVKDNNGQYSVSYKDILGNVVATALVGDTPKDPLSSGTDLLHKLSDNVLADIVIDLNQNNYFDAASNSYITNHSILNIIPTTYTFKYDLTGVVNSLPVCNTCSYDLEFTITDPAGKPVAVAAVPGGINGGVAACSTSVFVKDGLINQIFTFNDVGIYKIRKVLKLNADALIALRAKFEVLPQAPQLNVIEAAYINNVDYQSCDMTCEDKALTANPTWDRLTNSAQIQTWIDDNCQVPSDVIADSYTSACNGILATIEQEMVDRGFTAADAPLHEEYCHYTACLAERDTKKYNFDMMTAINANYVTATANGYLDPMNSQLANHDPIYNNATLRNAIIAKMNNYCNGPLYTNDPKVVYTLMDYAQFAANNSSQTSLTPTELAARTAQIFSSSYQALKERILVDSKKASGCNYRDPEYAIVPEPYIPANINFSQADLNAYNSMVNAAMSKDCRELSEVNAQYIIDQLYQNGCTNTTLSAANAQLVKSYLKDYLFKQCSNVSNPLALLLQEDISFVNNPTTTQAQINAKPGFASLKKALVLIGTCGNIDNISHSNTYLPGTPYTTYTSEYIISPFAYEVMDGINAILAEERSFVQGESNLITTCPTETDDLYTNQAYTFNNGVSNLAQYNLISNNVIKGIDPLEVAPTFLSIVHDYTSTGLIYQPSVSSEYNNVKYNSFHILAQSDVIPDFCNANKLISLNNFNNSVNSEYKNLLYNKSARTALTIPIFFLEVNGGALSYVDIKQLISISNPTYVKLNSTYTYYSNYGSVTTSTDLFTAFDATLLINGSLVSRTIYFPSQAVNFNANPFGPQMFTPRAILGSPDYVKMGWIASGLDVRQMDNFLIGTSTSTVTPTSGIVQCTTPQSSNNTGPQQLCAPQVDLIQLRLDCRADMLNTAKEQARIDWEQQMEAFIKEQVNISINNCLSSIVKENFTVSYKTSEYQYTLYYYNQAGNLIATVPPEGVIPLAITSFPNGKYNGTMPAHTVNLFTTYKYNSAGQLVYQKNLDGGITNFFYDSKGQMRLSQNAEQRAKSTPTSNRFVYSKLDALGRLIETGEVRNLAEAESYFINMSNRKASLALLDNPNYPSGNIYKDVVKHVYNDATLSDQTNVRNRIASSITMDDGVNVTTRSFYSYDILGNPKKITQEVVAGQQKTLEYTYDLLSGLIKRIDYQKDKADQYASKYWYDADNRLRNVYSSFDGGILWKEDAEYFYSLHGSLVRTELGEQKVQGMDYATTLQGWIKMANTPLNRSKVVTSTSATVFTNNADIGGDGIGYASPTNTNRFVAMDEFAFAVGFYKNDYAPINASGAATIGLAATAHTGMQAANVTTPTGVKGSGLYNGNITWMITQLNSLSEYMPSNIATDGADFGIRATAYQYDQLNRLKNANNYKNINTANTGVAGSYLIDTRWNASYGYDRNGNIRNSSIRNEVAQMDLMSYKYDTLSTSGANVMNRLSNHNKLNWVRDTAPIGADTDDMENQATGNYGYDAIGNLIKDTKEKITLIEWTIYGKVARVTKSDGTTMEFVYDAMGNRVRKVKKSAGATPSITSETTYLRDINGDIIATYFNAITSTKTEIEYSLYGSGRLGTRKNNDLDRGTENSIMSYTALFKYKPVEKKYELVNYLGNVHAIIANFKKGIDVNGDGIAEFYKALPVSLSDYYSFGMNIRSRSWQEGAYRFGFNGKEKDKNDWNTGAVYDYGFRIYDPRIAKFLSVDPLFKGYPWNSSYAFAENDVIRSIDLDGAEKLVVVQHSWNVDGSSTRLSMYLHSDGNNWTGQRVLNEYFFTRISGEIVYYSSSRFDGVQGDAHQKMMADNPHYFQALVMYHQFQKEQAKRLVADGAIITGGLISTWVTGGAALAGTSSAFMTAFGMTSGIFAIGAGTGKFLLDGMGKFSASDKLPNSPLGGFGIAIDAIKGGKSLTYQNLGDIASGIITLFGGGKADWSKWTALTASEKAIGAEDLLRGIYNQLNQKIEDDKLKKYGKDLTSILDEYARIAKANE